MPNQLKATQHHSEASNYLTVTHGRTFNGKPLYYHESGLILEYLEDIDQVLAEALNQYPRLFAVHLNLNLPSHFRGDYLTVFAHFLRTLESETKELCKNKYTNNTYQHPRTVFRYIWARECDSTRQYHLILLFDRELFQSLGTGRDSWGRFLYKKVRKTWDKVMEAHSNQRCSGLAYSPNNEGFELFSDTETFPLQLNEFFYRMSRLAKPTTKHDDNRSTSFGCSRR